jgi:hypothetical protein
MRDKLIARPLHAIVMMPCWLEPLTFASRLSKQPLPLNDVPNSQPQCGAERSTSQTAKAFCLAILNSEAT